MAGYVFIVSAPSAAGKTSLVYAVLEQFSERVLSRVVTYTTRLPRPGERDGIDYHFVSEQYFWQLYDTGALIECSCAYGAWYGSAWHAIRDIPSGTGRIMVIDRNGAKRVAAAYEHAVLIWVTPSRVAILHDRLRQRGIAEHEMEHRLQQSHVDMHNEYNDPIYDYWVINDHFEHARDRLRALIASYVAT